MKMIVTIINGTAIDHPTTPLDVAWACVAIAPHIVVTRGSVLGGMGISDMGVIGVVRGGVDVLSCWVGWVIITITTIIIPITSRSILPTGHPHVLHHAPISPHLLQLLLCPRGLVIGIIITTCCHGVSICSTIKIIPIPLIFIHLAVLLVPHGALVVVIEATSCFQWC